MISNEKVQSETAPCKPADKVRLFLDKKENKGDFISGTRLPTAEELAGQLQVSSGTVKNVYRAFASEGRIKTQVGVGSFWVGSSTASRQPYRIGIKAGGFSGQTDRWWVSGPWAGPIFGGVLKRKLECELTPSLEACGEFGEEGETRFPELDGLDGLISISIRPLPEAIFDSQGRKVPHVCLNPPRDQSCTNFVSPDYFVCSRRLGETWLKTGRRRVLFLSPPLLSQSVSTRLRFSGLVCGLGEAVGSGVEVKVLNTGSPDSDQAFGEFLDKGNWVPDAVYCTGDGLALGVIETLAKRGFSVPREVSVVGGCRTELTATAAQPLSCMVHPLEAVGAALFDMLLRRLQSHGKDEPGRFEPVPFHIGSTTRPEENECLVKHSREVLASVPAGFSQLL